MNRFVCFSFVFSFSAEDFYLVKKLSSAGIFAIVKKSDSKFNMRQFLHTETWVLGVVVDLHCYENNRSTIVFSEVKNSVKSTRNLMNALNSFPPAFCIKKKNIKRSKA